MSLAGNLITLWQQRAERIERQPDYLQDRALVSELYSYLLFNGSNAARNKLLSDLSTCAAKDQLKGHADKSYIAAFEPLLPRSFADCVIQRNKQPASDQEIGRLTDTLSVSRADLEDYIETKSDLIRTRHEFEYRFVQHMEFPHYPYCYLNAYARANLLPVDRSSISIDLVLCVKNRSVRTLLALRSLDLALSNYRRQSFGGLSVDVILVEAVSSNMLDLTTETFSSLTVDHVIVDIGDGWTRSGLVNCGIRRSKADLIAMLDADFLFHRDFFSALDRTLNEIDFDRNVAAVNVFETETHLRNNEIISEGSPYGYMWVVSRTSALKVSGFDEGYWGHGFEDRDFEMKLKRVAGLTVCDTYSVDKSCFVLHLSHTMRTGAEQRTENKARLMERSITPVQKLGQDKWGNFSSLAEHAYQPTSSSVGHAVIDVDFLLVPHKRYHSLSFLAIRESLQERGYSSLLLDLNPIHPDEGAVISSENTAFCSLADLTGGRLVAKAVVCMNDWENRVVRHLVEACNAHNIPTIGIVEGVSDFKDIDTGSNRRAYQRVRTVLLNGSFDRRYFEELGQKTVVVGIERLDSLSSRPASAPSDRAKPIALANVNFSYGINCEHREAWLRDIQNACNAAGYDLKVTQHPADDAELSQYDRDDRTFLEAVTDADVFISRFSGGVLEALGLGKDVIYYNPGFEKIDKFTNPLGAYLYTHDVLEIRKALEFYASGKSLDPSEFLNAHGDIEQFGPRIPSRHKTADALIKDLLHASPTAASWRNAVKTLSARLEKFGFTHAALLNPEPDLMRRTTFAIKSFGRTEQLDRLVQSIKARYPESPVIVCDDSGEPSIQEIVGITLLRPGSLDIGLSAGRNMLLDACETEFFVLLDDDFVFTERTNIPVLVAALNEQDVDIVGGSVYDVGPSAKKTEQPRTFYGQLTSNNGELYIATGLPTRMSRGQPLYDLVLNFFAARTASLQKVRWTGPLKLAEHLDFFIRAKRIGLRIGYRSDVVVDHWRDTSLLTEGYKTFRQRAHAFNEDFKEIHGIRKIFKDSKEIIG